MSDARWFEIEADADAATRHSSGAAEIIASRTRDCDAAHTLMERSLIRVIDLLGEERSSGARWHDDLIRVAAAPLASRPAILTPDLAAAVLAGGLRGAFAAFRHAIDP